MNKEIVDNKLIEVYLEKLVAAFGVRPLVLEQVLYEQYAKGNYASCISIIKGHMRLENKLAITCYASNKYPYKDASLARIEWPSPMPHIESNAFKQLTFKIEFQERLRNHFYIIVFY